MGANSFSELNYRNFHTKANNAFKTYLGFAKLAMQKLTETKKKFSAQDLKSLISNNRELLKRLASMAMPLLMLFDNMNGVVLGLWICIMSWEHNYFSGLKPMYFARGQ